MKYIFERERERERGRPAPKFGFVNYDNWGGTWVGGGISEKGSQPLITTGTPSHKCPPKPAPLIHAHIY